MFKIKEEILKYENEILNKYLKKRILLINKIENIQFENLNNNQLEICINDLKEITNSLINNCDNIDFFINNANHNFVNNQTIITNRYLTNLSVYFLNLPIDNCFLPPPPEGFINLRSSDSSLEIDSSDNSDSSEESGSSESEYSDSLDSEYSK